jgi:acetylornithine deacetylase/succinyl-diaminopimelate desuccinylase-like protein
MALPNAGAPPHRRQWRHVVSYGTEGSQFQTRGYSTVICGPGDIAQAHQPDEFLSLEQLAAGEAFVTARSALA